MDLLPLCLCLTSTLRCPPPFSPPPHHAAVEYILWHTMYPFALEVGRWRAWAGRLGGTDAISGSPCLSISLALSCIELSSATCLMRWLGVGRWATGRRLRRSWRAAVVACCTSSRCRPALMLCPRRMRRAWHRSCCKDSADGWCCTACITGPNN